MAEIREVVTVSEDTTTSNSLMGIFIVAVVALLAIGLMVWQPWSTNVVQDRTIITTPNPAPSTTIVNPPAPASNTTIVNPPAPKTDVNIIVPEPSATTGD